MPTTAERPALARRRTVLVVFTDLDGTLLSERTYSWAAARPALRQLARLRVPLVFCSSKTRAEILFWRRRLDNGHPFISENGGGIFIPRGYFPGLERLTLTEGLATIPLGTPYARLREEFSDLRQKFGAGVRGFGDMTIAEISTLTGLPRTQAALARQRDFDEPFIFTAGSGARFLKAIKAAGRQWTRGRLQHMMGNHDKGRAVRLLLQRFALGKEAVVSAALGDGFNDLPMLQAVDHPFLVRQASGGFASGVGFPGLTRTRGAGPAGWNEAIMALLDELGWAGVGSARGKGK